jgi:hypothetical protein
LQQSERLHRKFVEDPAKPSMANIGQPFIMSRSIEIVAVNWVPLERRKRGRPRKTWMEGVQAAMTTRNLETDQLRNREEWRLVSGRLRQLL